MLLLYNQNLSPPLPHFLSPSLSLSLSLYIYIYIYSLLLCSTTVFRHIINIIPLNNEIVVPFILLINYSISKSCK